MIAEQVDSSTAVEAALFAAGRPLTTEEIAAALGMSVKEVKAAISSLRGDYESRGSAIEFIEQGGKFAMQLRGQHARNAVTFAPREMSNPVLRTLALIAYYQPVLQSDLASMRGNKAYDHVAELVEMKLINKRQHRRTYMLTTASRFAEYFEMPGATSTQVKERIGKQSRGETLDGWMGEKLSETDILRAVRKLVPKRVV